MEQGELERILEKQEAAEGIAKAIVGAVLGDIRNVPPALVPVIAEALKKEVPYLHATVRYDRGGCKNIRLWKVFPRLNQYNGHADWSTQEDIAILEAVGEGRDFEKTLRYLVGVRHKRVCVYPCEYGYEGQPAAVHTEVYALGREMPLGGA
jgi:hypothetical protein